MENFPYLDEDGLRHFRDKMGEEIPKTLPNPQPLSFGGMLPMRTYDGSVPVDVDFPNVEIMNETVGSPVGEIISYMGVAAPPNYLICDGAEYRIADYPYLAKHFEDNFGAVNFFGGDGETTFAVPDLRGEFLRGTGENGHENQGNGSSIGSHQNATTIPNTYLNNNNDSFCLYLESLNKPSYPDNDDSSINSAGLLGRYITTTPYETTVKKSAYTVRPTNTSVLYCIKCKPTYYAKIGTEAPAEWQTSSIIFDGKTKVFDLPETDSEYSVYVNGLYMSKGVDYTIGKETNQIIFNDVFDDFDTCTLTYYA